MAFTKRRYFGDAAIHSRLLLTSLFALASSALPLFTSGCALVAGLSDHEPEPAPIVLARDQGHPRSLAVDDVYVYWIDEDDSTIRRAPKAGGGAAQIILPKDDAVRRVLAVDLAHVYWFEAPADPMMTPGLKSRVVRMKKGGGTTEELWRIDTTDPEPSDIALDGTTVFFTIANWRDVYQVDKVSKEAKKIADNEGNVHAITLDSTHAYWTNDGAGQTVQRYERLTAPNMITPFTPPQDHPSDITNDANTVFWLTEGGSVVSLDKAKPLATPNEIASGQYKPTSIAVDDEYVYWTNAGDGTIMRALKTGTAEPEVVADGQNYPDFIAIDETHIYWAAYDGGRVYAMKKRPATTSVKAP